MPATDTAAVLAGIARHGLRGAPPSAAVHRPAAWRDLHAALVEQRLTGLAVQATGDQALELAPDEYEELLTSHEEQLAVDLRVERLLLEVAGLLGEVGVEVRVLKGAGLAHRIYPDPALRSFGDCDLLVREEDLGRVIGTLRPLARRRFEEPKADFDARFTKAVCLVTDDGMELDLHRTLAPGPFGVRIRNGSLFDGPPGEIEVGGRRIATLPLEHDLLHACAHAVLGDVVPRLNTLRDILQIFECGVDIDRCIAVFETARCEVLAARACDLVERTLGVAVPSGFDDWARSARVTRRDRVELATYQRRTGRYPAQVAATFWALPRHRDRAAYASALALPSRQYLAARRQSYPRRVVRGVRLLVRWRPS